MDTANWIALASVVAALISAVWAYTSYREAARSADLAKSALDFERTRWNQEMDSRKKEEADKLVQIGRQYCSEKGWQTGMKRFMCAFPGLKQDERGQDILIRALKSAGTDFPSRAAFLEELDKL